ncbi:Uncharacterised protein [Mycobacterium tuberculosis]|nr:Uncharacterised protein [Mycobacterium tuberculosis]
MFLLALPPPRVLSRAQTTRNSTSTCTSAAGWKLLRPVTRSALAAVIM